MTNRDHSPSVARNDGGDAKSQLPAEHQAAKRLGHIEAQPYLVCELGDGHCKCERDGESKHGCLWSYWKRPTPLGGE